MGRVVIVLATLHEFQSLEKFFRTRVDPIYANLLGQLIDDEHLDFIFEEASGLGPSTAQELSREKLGPDRYLDVDPYREQRESLGIRGESGEPYFIDGSPQGGPTATWQFLEAHERREEIWLQRILQQEFEKALMICGVAHTLSFAFRLRAEEQEVKILEYSHWIQTDPEVERLT
jgi:hypothetical protein